MLVRSVIYGLGFDFMRPFQSIQTRTFYQSVKRSGLLFISMSLRS